MTDRAEYVVGMDGIGAWIRLPGGLQYREQGMNDLRSARKVLAESGISLSDVAYDHSLAQPKPYSDVEGANLGILLDLAATGLDKAKSFVRRVRSEYRLNLAPDMTAAERQPDLNARLAVLLR